MRIVVLRGVLLRMEYWMPHVWLRLWCVERGRGIMIACIRCWGALKARASIGPLRRVCAAKACVGRLYRMRLKIRTAVDLVPIFPAAHAVQPSVGIVDLAGTIHLTLSALAESWQPVIHWPRRRAYRQLHPVGRVFPIGGHVQLLPRRSGELGSGLEEVEHHARARERTCWPAE